MPIDLPFEAYQGTDPYLFVSYAHTDSGAVYPEMEWLHGQSHRMWYDEGIELGSEWSDAIAQAIEGCAQFLVFLSPTAVESKHVKEEIFYAFSKGKTILCIHLEPTTLTGGLEMRLGPFQAIHRHELTRDVYEGKVLRTLSVESKAAPGVEPQVVAPPDPERMRADPQAPPATKMEPVPQDFTNSLGMEMIWCPPGKFLMGSPESEEGWEEWETQHEVTLTKGFWISRYQVTQQQWEQLMGDNPSHFKESGPQAPVETVSWEESMEFCRKLGESEQGDYMLPTEAQWEYACRAGTTGPFAGSSLDALGWYADNSGIMTHPVGQKSPNPWGIYDMHGNVWEWCRDSSDWPPDSNGHSVADPVGMRGPIRVDRGGGFCNSAARCRSASRGAGPPTIRYNDLGLRPCLVPSSTVQPNQ